MNRIETERQSNIPFYFFVPFLVFTFALAWGIIALFVFLPDTMNSLFGPLTGDHPLFFLAVYSPAIAACGLVIKHSGFNGLRRFLSRALLWRCHWAWYLLLILGIPLLFVGGSLVKGNLAESSFAFPSLATALLALLLALIKGPIEEIGWRGLALPLLQRKLAPFWAGLILGIIWGFWHLPAFVLSGTPQSAWSFTPFFLGSVSISLIVTPLFNRSGGSILLPALFHFQANNPLWPDAQPYDTIFFVGAAVIVVWLNRKTLFAREYGVTSVIPYTD